MAVQITQLGSEISTLANAQSFGQGAAGYANVAPLQGGGFVKVWADGDRKGYYQIFSDNGMPLSPASQIDVLGLYTINDLPTVSSLPGGGFAIAWRSGLFERGGIVAEIYAPGGAPIVPAFAVNSQVSYDQLQPDIAQIGDDRFIVTWQSGGREIKAQIFDLNGTKIGNEIVISSTINGNLPTVTSLSNGGFSVSWVEFGFLGSAVYNKTFGPDYVSSAPPFKSSFADGSDPGLLQPVAASISPTQYVLTWGFSSGSSYPVALYGQVFDNDGTASGATFLVADSIGDVRPGSVVGIGNNRFAVTWDQSGTIKAQIFDGTGQKIGSEINVKQNVSENIFGPEISTLANGNIVVSWKEGSDPVNGVNSVLNISKIFDVNTSPAFSANTIDGSVALEIAENTLDVTSLSATDLDAGDVLTYSISGGLDAALFQIDAATGALSLRSPADFETPADIGVNNVYNVEVQVSDGALTDTRLVSVTVANVNEAPLIIDGGGANTAAVSLLENTRAVTTVTATDADANTTLSYSISGGADAALFDVDAATGALSFKSAPNFEAPADVGSNNVYDVEVQVSDGTLTDTQAIAVTVTNANEAPIVATAITDQAIVEDTAWSYTVPADAFSDVDSNLLTYTATLGDGSQLPDWLRFDPLTRTFEGRPPLDFTGNINLTVTASDGASEVSDSFTLQVSRVNDAPAGQANLLKRIETFVLQPAAEISILAENNPGISSPTVANLRDGGWIVTWSSLGGGGISAQRYNADGSVSGDKIEVNTGNNIRQGSATVSGCTDGGWVIAWEIFDPQTGGQICFRRFDANGTPLGAEFQVTSNVLGGGIGPSLAALSDGGWVVSWMAAPGLQADSAADVLFQKFDSFGTPVSEITIANTYFNNNQVYPSVAALPDGGWILTWTSEGQDSKQLGNFGQASGVFGQRFSSTAEKVGQEFQINTYSFLAQFQPNVTALSDGGWLVTWTSEGQDGDQFRFGNYDAGIYGQRYAPNGARVGTEFKINTTINLREIEPVVAGLNDGGWVVAWSRPSSITVPDGYTDVFAQRFSSNGQKVGDEVKVNTFDAGYQDAPKITAMNDGGWLIFWNNGDPQSAGVYGQRFDAAGNRNDVIREVSYQELATSTLTEKDTIVIDSSLVSDADGLGQISWQWQRSNDGGTSWIDIAGENNNSYSLSANDIGNVVRARGVYTDAQGTLETIYSVQSGPILNVNDAPILTIPLPDQTISEDTTWSYQVSADTFSDVDSDALTFSATLGDGSALPTWLSFDAATRTFAGTPPQNFNGDVALTVTASDGALHASDSFNLSVQAVNDAPSGSLQMLKSTGVAISNPLPAFSLPLISSQPGGVPAIAPLTDGGWITAWSFGRAGGSSIGTQRYAPNGDPIGSPAVIESGIDVSLSEPKIATLPDGGWITSWVSYLHTGDPYNPYKGSSIIAQRFGRDGIPIGEKFTVIDENGGLNDSPQIFKYEPEIATLSDGGWVFTWTMDITDGQGLGIYGHKFNADGLSSGGIFRISSSTIGRDESPSVTGLKDGGWVVTWTSDFLYGEIFSQVYSADGTPVGRNTNVNYTGVTSQTISIVSALNDGGYVIAWTSPSEDGTINRIVGQRFSANGLQIGDQFTVASNAGAPSDIVTLSDGGWLIAWSQYSDIGGPYLATQRYSVDGTAIGGIQQYEGQIAGNQDSTQLAALRNGGWVALWQGYDPANFTSAISGQQFDANGNLGWTNLELADPLTTDFTEGNYLYANADMITDPEGVGVIYWQWQRKVSGEQNWQDIVGADNDRYILTDTDIGSVIRLRGQYTDGNGTVETVYSPASPPIAFLNDAPTLAASIADQSATEDAAFSFVVPAGSFADVDPGDVLTLSASLPDGSPLPAWLDFDSTTMTFSGTPLRGDVGTVSVRVTATDIGGLSVSDIFDLAIAAETIAPTATITDNVPGTAIGTIAYTVTFSEPVTGLAANDFAVGNGTIVSIEGSGQSYIVNVAPTANFEGSLLLSLNAAAVLDKAGNTNLAVLGEFQQVDTRAPVLTTITPAADSIGALVTTNISLAYSEGVRAGTGVIELRTAAGVLVESFNVATSNRLSFTGSTLTIDPTASLNGATQYRLTVPQGAVLDAAGNAAAALATYAFTTQALVNIINGTAVANTLNGTAGDDEIYGLGGNDTLNGNAGNDLLDGGSGVDRMAGGAGNDIYVVDNAADAVTEAANAGIDLVRTTRNNYTLTTNVENLTYLGDAAFTGTGNALANRIEGGIGNDTLDGGAGADIMVGGIGNDRYTVDNVGDVVIEQASAGTDTVSASMSYVLGANVENLTLTGNGALNGTGNAVANIITGNNGANILRGSGGADTLNGGAGTDTALFEQAVANYAIDHSGTAIIVSDLVGSEGTDTLTAIETLSFLGSSYAVVAGTTAANVINGGAGSQAIFGLAGADTINGGAGNDIVIGGIGNDNISLASDTGGRDFIDGGAGEDTFTLLTAAGAENFVIYTRAAAQQAIAGLTINPNSEIVVTRNGAVIAELDNIEEIVVSSLRVTSPAGANGGTVAGDTVQVVGDFNQTSLNFNTITVNGTTASDTVDITGLQSEHRIVFTGNGGTDNVVGSLRPQDIFVTDSAATATSGTSASLPALKQAAIISAEPVNDDASPQMHRLHHKEADDGMDHVTSLLRDMFDDSKSGSMFRHWDATDKRQEAKIDDHPGLRHNAGEDDIKLYDDSWSDALIRRPDSWHAEFEHLM